MHHVIFATAFADIVYGRYGRYFYTNMHSNIHRGHGTFGFGYIITFTTYIISAKRP